MLLTQMPAHPDAPEPKRANGQSPREAIAFDQAIHARKKDMQPETKTALLQAYLELQQVVFDLYAASEAAFENNCDFT